MCSFFAPQILPPNSAPSTSSCWERVERLRLKSCTPSFFGGQKFYCFDTIFPPQSSDLLKSYQSLIPYTYAGNSIGAINNDLHLTKVLLISLFSVWWKPGSKDAKHHTHTRHTQYNSSHTYNNTPKFTGESNVRKQRGTVPPTKLQRW